MQYALTPDTAREAAPANKLVALEALRFLSAFAILVFHYRHFFYVASEPIGLVQDRLPLHGVLHVFYDHGRRGVPGPRGRVADLRPPNSGLSGGASFGAPLSKRLTPSRAARPPISATARERASTNLGALSGSPASVAQGAAAGSVTMTRAPILVQFHILTAKAAGMRMQPCEAG